MTERVQFLTNRLPRCFSRSRKASYSVQDGIPELESFLQRAGRNPGAGKLPAACRTESRSWKASCNVQDGIPELESLLQHAGRNRAARKLPAACRAFSRFAAGRFRRTKKKRGRTREHRWGTSVFSVRRSAQVLFEIRNLNSEIFRQPFTGILSIRR